MKYLMSAEWWKAAGIRAAKTMFQTGAALVVTQMPGGSVDWMAVGSAVIVAGVASLGTSPVSYTHLTLPTSIPV